MRFKDDFFRRYLGEAPVPLAIERSLECAILSRQRFEAPVLDIGTGEGMFAYILFDEPIDVGIDPDARELERAKQYGMYRELINCGGASVPKPSGSFKTVFSNSVLEHIPDLEPVLREAHRLLAPDGRMYATVPTHLFDHYSLVYQALSALGFDGAAESFRRFFNSFWRHYHFHTPDGWRVLFERCGFRVVESRQYCPRSIGLLNDALAPLSIPSLVVKKLLNRWFLFPSLRAAVGAPLLARVFGGVVRTDPGESQGGIIFFRLERG